MSAVAVLYRAYGADDALLYIGRTVSPVLRFKDHQNSKSWWNEVALIRLEHFDNPAELKHAEYQAIQLERPKYNWTGNSGNPAAATTLALSHTGEALAATRAARDKAFQEAELVALQAIDEGATEVEIARVLGVDRMTVRKWRGKR